MKRLCLFITLIGSILVLEVQANDRQEEILEQFSYQGKAVVIIDLHTTEGAEQEVGTADISDLQVDKIRRGLFESSAISPLIGTNIVEHYEITFIPTLILEVDEVGYNALLAHPQVKSIRLDTERFYPNLKGSVKHITGLSSPWTKLGYAGRGWWIAIIDTGVDLNHTMFQGKSKKEACFTARYSCPNGSNTMVRAGAAKPVHYHGTHVAGIALGRYMPTRGFGGVAHKANILAINVFEKSGGAYDSSLLRALQYVYNQRSRIPIASVNMSLGDGSYNSSTCDSYETSYYYAFEKLKRRKIASVLSAGNRGWSWGAGSPACVSNAVSVASSTKWNDTFSSFSNAAQWVDLIAPGSSIYSALPYNKFGTLNGTSMAAPHVAGAFAVLKEKFSSASVTAIKTALAASGEYIFNQRISTEKHYLPRIDVRQALKNIGSFQRTRRFGFNRKSVLSQLDVLSRNKWSIYTGTVNGARGVIKSDGAWIDDERVAFTVPINLLNGSVAARMYRNSSDYYQEDDANTLFVRTAGQVDLDQYNYDHGEGYFLQYSNDGYYSIYKMVDGVQTTLKSWTYSSIINRYGWNTLLVTTGGKKIRFFINGFFLHEENDAKLVYGRPGISYYKSTLADAGFMVDWLYANVGSSNPITYYADSQTSVESEEPVSLEREITIEVEGGRKSGSQTCLNQSLPECRESSG